MKKVYVAHPLRGDTRDIQTVFANISKVDDLLRRLAAKHENDGILLLSPIHAFAFVSALGPDEWVLEQCRELLSLADEIWVFGDWEHSEGCRMEVEHARNLGMKVIFKEEAERHEGEA